MKKFMIILLGLLAVLPPLYAQDKLKTTALNVFKNGTYFIVKEGNVPLSRGKYKLEIPKQPLMGTFWLTTQKDLAVERITFITDTLKINRTAGNLADLLRANKGKKVRLNIRLDEKNYSEVSGVLQDYFTTFNTLKVKMSDGKTAYIPAADVKQFFVDDNPAENLQADSTSYLANIEFNRDVKDARIKIVYMQPGIQWIPSYNIKVLNDKELQLEMKALVENFAEPVNEAELTLTVGDPNYKFGRTTEPFVNQYLTNLYGTPQPAFNQYLFQNAPAQMSRMAESLDAGAVQYNDYQEYTTNGEKVDDLYFYRLGKISLPKNSKTSFQIFSQKLTYKDVYRAVVPDYVNFVSTQYIDKQNDMRTDVYHSLKLNNITKTPLTTAPVFVMNEALEPVAQDEIKYTPVNGNVSVQLSKSPDIVVKNTEDEKERHERAKVLNKAYYTQVILEGKIEVENLQNKEITLNLVKNLNAKILEAGNDGKISIPGRNQGLNPQSIVEWEIQLKPDEKKTITYRYEAYVYAN